MLFSSPSDGRATRIQLVDQLSVWSCPGLVERELLSGWSLYPPEGDSEIAPPWSIVAPEGTGRSPLAWVRSKVIGDRYSRAEWRRRGLYQPSMKSKTARRASA